MWHFSALSFTYSLKSHVKVLLDYFYILFPKEFLVQKSAYLVFNPYNLQFRNSSGYISYI